jgi:hypothetical protein
VRESENKDILIPIALGLISFFFVVGYKILFFSNIGWLEEGDPSTSFISWNFFRSSDWAFPLGLNPSYGTISPNSIVYSDANVLLALIFKLFTKSLPATFQYFGVWILTCFILQSIISWKLVKLLTKDIQICSLATILFIFAPPFLWRLEMHIMHIQLLGHFFILGSLYLAIKYKQTYVLNYYQWSLILGLSILIHSYITLMCFLIFLSIYIDHLISLKNNYINELKKIFYISTLMIFIAWISGFFVIGSGVSASGFGFYKMNLLALIDPAMNNYKSWSYIIPNISGESGQHEGFNYLGLGLILFSLFSVNTFIKNKTEILELVNKYKYIYYLLIFLTLFALSNYIHFGGIKIMKIPLPDIFLSILNIFRASGRFFWPVFYCIILFNIYLLIKYVNLKKSTILMYLFVCIQLIDTSSGWAEIRNNLNSYSSNWSDGLNDKFWQAASAKYKNIIYTKSGLPENWQNISYYASKNKMKTNIAYLNRFDSMKYDYFYKALEVNLLNKDFKADTLYILDVDSFSKLYTLIGNDKLCNGDLISIVDGVHILAPAFNKTQCILK